MCSVPGYTGTHRHAQAHTRAQARTAMGRGSEATRHTFAHDAAVPTPDHSLPAHGNLANPPGHLHAVPVAVATPRSSFCSDQHAARQRQHGQHAAPRLRACLWCCGGGNSVHCRPHCAWAQADVPCRQMSVPGWSWC